MSLRAITFAVSKLATGLALVCPEARYASITSRGAARLDRRYATPSQWKQAEFDLQLGPRDRSSRRRLR